MSSFPGVRPCIASSLKVALIEERLQDQCGCHLVDNPAVLLSLVAGFVQDPVSLMAGQPLIP